eukprot:1144366_1
MAHDIFDYKDGWEQDIDEDEVIDLEEDARKQRQELLAQQWREGELFVTSDYVLVYENPTDPSPVVCEFEPDTVILLSSLQESSNYGGFRDVLLPIRGWVWTSVDEYDRAFHDASMLLRNVQTRDTSTSMQRLGKYVKRKVHKINKKKRSKRAGSDKTNDSTEFDVETRQYAFSDAELMKSDHHSRGKTNHLYVNQQQHEAKKQSEFAADDHSIDAAEYTPEPPSVHSMHGIEFSTSLEHSSKYRRMSHQVHYNPAAIEKISKPLSLEELEAFENEIDPAHIQTDSDGVFLGNTKKDEKKEALIDDKEKEKEEEEEEEQKQNETEKEKEHDAGKWQRRMQIANKKINALSLMIDESQTNKVRVALRLPNGKRVEHMFCDGNCVESLFDFALCHELKIDDEYIDDFELVCSYPKRIFTQNDKHLSLKSVGIQHSTILFVQEKD